MLNTHTFVLPLSPVALRGYHKIRIDRNKYLKAASHSPARRGQTGCIPLLVALHYHQVILAKLVLSESE